MCTESLRRILLVVAATLAGVAFAPLAQAQHGVGNGGIGVACPTEDGREVFSILDQIYGNIAWGFVPDLGPPELAWRTKVRRMIARIPDIDAGRRRYYEHALQYFFSRVTFVQASSLRHTFDFLNEAPFILELQTRQCRYVQLANLLVSEERADFHYRIDRHWFEDVANNDERALLVMHEIVYAEYVQYDGPKSLEPVYFLVSMLASREIAHIPPEQYQGLVESTGWPLIDVWHEY